MVLPDRPRVWAAALAVLGSLLASGCAVRGPQGGVSRVDPAEFMPWSCARIHEETDLVQRRAVEVAWPPDQPAGQQVVSLGAGLTVFWPALMAMQPYGDPADRLLQHRRRFEALEIAARWQRCPAPTPGSALPLSVTPVLPGQRLVYEERAGVREPLSELVLDIEALRRDRMDLVLDRGGSPGAAWRQDLAGNVIEAPAGMLQWQDLLARRMAVGDVLAGAIGVVGDARERARVRGQVIAVGPQDIAGRRFDAAVIELFGDVGQGTGATRLEGALVVDRNSGVLLHLDLRSAEPRLRLQRRLVRVVASP